MSYYGIRPINRSCGSYGPGPLGDEHPDNIMRWTVGHRGES